MAKKMRTRAGVDGFNYPYTHEDLIFSNDNVPLSKKLSDTKNKLDEMDTALQTKASTESVTNMLNGLCFIYNNIKTNSRYDLFISTVILERRNDNGVSCKIHIII